MENVLWPKLNKTHKSRIASHIILKEVVLNAMTDFILKITLVIKLMCSAKSIIQIQETAQIVTQDSNLTRTNVSANDR